MYTGQVIGTVVCSQKYETLTGKKLLVVQVIENGKPTKKIVALDGIGFAGEGDFVYLCGGREAALPFGKMSETPTEASIVGFVDTIFIDPAYRRN
ncbi:MAG: EutN/CcmL family microcompartment protein [Eubacteriales bacterium]